MAEKRPEKAERKKVPVTEQENKIFPYLVHLDEESSICNVIESNLDSRSLIRAFVFHYLESIVSGLQIREHIRKLFFLFLDETVLLSTQTCV